jgi:putative ABC transport system permease protein
MARWNLMFAALLDRLQAGSGALTRSKRTVVLGLRSLWLHRLRSLLTVLGIVFGVCSVIAMLAVGEGASSEAQEQIRRLGSTNIIVRSVKPNEERPPTATRGYAIEYGITYRDIDRIKNTIATVKDIMPGRIIRKPVSCGRQRAEVEIVGTLPQYEDLRHLVMRAGRFISDIEMVQDANAAVLSATLAEKLFPIDDPLGSTVRVGSDYYRVIGIAEDEGGGVPQAGTPNPAGGPGARAGTSLRMYIPLTAAKNRFGETLIKRQSGSFEAERVQLHEATIMVDQTGHVEETAAIVREILQANHKKNDFEIVVPLELLRNAERTKRIFNVVLGAIAAISLIVGGIGIMNIMLASVTERTREIGIRRALGARKRDIVVQFLAETVILSGAGGIIGVALGVIIPFAITYFAEMKTIVTFWSPLLAFGISALVGVVFGIYPALRAAEMDPVEALRHE